MRRSGLLGVTSWQSTTAPALDSTSLHVNALLEVAFAARENSMEEGAA